MKVVIDGIEYVPVEKEKMDDLISRQAAIDAVEKNTFRLTVAEEQNCEGHVAWSADAVYSSVIKGTLLDLPSAQPKHGYWTESHEHIYITNGVKEWTNWYCSECDAPNDKPTDFCPYCGADMRGRLNE